MNQQGFSPAGHFGARPSILLVEDDESLRRAVSLKLSREGYLLHTAATREFDT